MRRFVRSLPMVFVAASLFVAGCGQATGGGVVAPAPTQASVSFQWQSLSDCTTSVIVWLNEGTNWLLNKSQVSVSKVSDVRPAVAGEGFVADFKIVVVDGNNTFDATAKDVECDELGVPSDASVDKLREAVERIKAKIKRLQN